MKRSAKFLIFASLGLIGALSVYAFNEPPSASLDLSVNVPLNVGAVAQAKLGGLALNSGKGDTGLIVYDFINPGLEKLGIGLADPLEKLHLLGNWNIDGIIKPDGLIGRTDDVLTNVFGQQMEWGNVAWLSIQRIDVVLAGSCVQIWPDCPEGWTNYGDQIFSDACLLGDGVYTGWNATRVCYQSF